MNFNKDQNNLIEIEFNSYKDSYTGTLGNFTIKLPSPVILDPNSDYEMALNYMIIDNPYPSIRDSYYLYCDKVKYSRTATDLSNVLYKTLPIGLERNSINDRFIKVVNETSIIDWKPLNSSNFNTLSFILSTSAGIEYPNGFLPDGSPVLQFKIAIRKSPYQQNMSIK